MSKFKTDYERLKLVKEYKVSRMSLTDFAQAKGISRWTLRDWVYAFDNLDGSFVKLNKAINSSEPSVILSNDDIRMKVLKPDEIIRKSSHFSRFDHSVVVIEFDRIKITTSLEQALAIMEKYYDRHE